MDMKWGLQGHLLCDLEEPFFKGGMACTSVVFAGHRALKRFIKYVPTSA
jgi:hypothetical protein